jgi:hypothetical protein
MGTPSVNPVGTRIITWAKPNIRVYAHLVHVKGNRESNNFQLEFILGPYKGDSARLRTPSSIIMNYPLLCVTGNLTVMHWRNQQLLARSKLRR